MQETHILTAENVLKHRATIAGQGLSGAEAAQRLNTHGPNELAEKGRKNAWRILLAQVKEVMILILLVAVAISAALQEYIDAIVIFIIVVLNTLLGFWQEFKAENPWPCRQWSPSPWLLAPSRC